MAQTFTPGPWHVGTTSTTAKDHAICESACAIGRAYGFGYPLDMGWSPTSAANARLMAAAPELLAACAALLENLERDSGHLGSPHVDYALQIGRAAIAKATGTEEPV